MERRPNLLFIIMDDLAWGDLACHGNPYTRTPHLDRLHAEGVRFVNYLSGPLCSPARASLMTGRYHYRTGVTDTYLGRSMMHADEVTLAEVLRAAGYATGLFGKWHLGDNYPMRPQDQGFEQVVMHMGGGIGQPADPPGNSYFDPALSHNGRLQTYQGYCTDLFAAETIRFIEEHREQPFFAYLATNCPHSPFEIAEEWVAPYRTLGLPETFARVYGMVENIDVNVGRVLAALDYLGLADDTVVVYTSDHGPCPSAMHEGQDRFNAGLRGRKGQMYDGGIRVPCFVRWPAGLPGGRDIDRIAHPIDWLPTLAAACGATLPEEAAVDGMDLMPLMSGEIRQEAWPDRTLFMQWHRGDTPQRFRNCAAVTQHYKLYRPRETDPDELYDREADPQEQKDVAAEHPEIVEMLRRRYDEWFDAVSAERGQETYDAPPIHLGTPHENPTVLTRQDWRVYSGAEGWSDDNPGWWQVKVVQDGRYRIELLLSPPASPAVLQFRCGPLSARRQVAAGTEVCTLDDLFLQAGDQRLEALLEVEGERLGVRYAHVTCRELPVVQAGLRTED